MSYFPLPQPRDHLCCRAGCNARLNHYGVYPNQAKHLEDDTRRHNKYESEKEHKRQYFETLLDSIFEGKPLPPIFSEEHKHVWEPYGSDKQCCKLCGIVAFNSDMH